MSPRLQLRCGVVVAEDPLTVEVDGERRPAWADTTLLGEMREGDEVVVNVAGLELGLGSGGFDVVHVNLTRGLDAGSAAAAEGREPPHVIKLNYTSLQHPVDPVEARDEQSVSRFSGPRDGKGAKPAVLVLPLHGHLAPAAWALATSGEDPSSPESGLRGRPTVGYVQTGGGALPGSMSRDVAELRGRGLLVGQITAAPAYGGDYEAISVSGALDAARRLGWDAVLVGPGPGIIGSDSELGHGGMAALDSAHAALALGLPTMISPRLSSADPRERHVGLSHHTQTVLELLLGAVEVAAPEPDGLRRGEETMEELRAACGERHDLRNAATDISAYAESGLPSTTMGRTLEEDPLFFAASLAAGAALRDTAGAALRRKG